jgi:hypothetical protein
MSDIKPNLLTEAELTEAYVLEVEAGPERDEVRRPIWIVLARGSLDDALDQMLVHMQRCRLPNLGHRITVRQYEP